ncbi:MAG: FAD-dependent oxidoreductase, partial [Bacillota bacterium]
EKAPHVLPPLDPELAPWIEKELARHEVRLITGTGLKALHAGAERSAAPAPSLVTHIELENNEIVETDLVLLSIGVRPNVKLAQSAGLSIGPTGAIAVDSFLRTSDPDIYAVGDGAEVIHAVTGKPARIPLAGPANRNGRIAGEHAATGTSPAAGKVLGTAVVGVFQLTAAVTGLGEAAARSAGFDVETAYVHPMHHAGYYPGAEQMHLKLIYDRPTGRLLGAQAVGGTGVDKRIDVLATAIHFGGTIDQLTELDLAYAPQYGSAKDPIHMAAFVAQNQQRGLSSTVIPEPVDGELLLDVRTPQEFAAGTVRGAINIPVDELRSRLSELDKDRPIRVLCQVGMRGYIAERILRQHGYSARNVKGGYLLARNMVECTTST